MADNVAAPKPAPFAFKDPARLSRWVRWLLYLQLVVAIIVLSGAMAELRVIEAIEAGAPDVAAIEANDQRQMLIGLLQSLTFIGSGIVILLWIHRANCNARQLSTTDLRYRPGWAVAWYFIPFLNLWKPYDAMREIWKASANPADWQTRTVTSNGLLPAWWAFWLLSNFAANISFRLTLGAEEVGEFRAANIASQISAVLGIPLTLIFLSLVNKIHAMQMAALPAHSTRPA